MHVLYNILAVVIVILAIPVFISRLLREDGFSQRLRQSLGFIPAEDLEPVARKNCIWLHAASVGEIVAASPIIKEMRREFPERPILVSVVTATGYAMAKRIMTDADSIIFCPLDLPVISRSVVKKIQPRLLILVETELWPNLLRAMRAFRIPVMMVNGRISDKSVQRYRYLHSVLEDMLGSVQKFCMQSQLDAQYIMKLGAEAGRVVVTGNTKFDQSYTSLTAGEQQRLHQELGLPEEGPVIVAGSTHKGEEECLLQAFQAVRLQHPSARLVIAPRDVMRHGEIAELAVSKGFSTAFRKKLLQQPSKNHDVIIIDTIGELGKIYSVGTVVYIGGSLVPRGGHNILEPAAHGKPIIVGPHMFNFKETYALFTQRNACLTAHSSMDLGEKILNILQDDEMRTQMAAASRAIIMENQGAARKNIAYVQELLSKEI